MLLPHIHRLLSRIYVPDYFIGRARTADGLLADPVNIAVIGTSAELRRSLLEAGWSEARPVTLRSGTGIVLASLLGRSDLSAPVSPLCVFGQKQTLAYEKEVRGSPDFSTGYHSRNGGGDAIESDGNLPIVTLPRAAR